MNYKQILERLKFWNKEDKRIRESFSKFMSEITPNDYPPASYSFSCVASFLDGLGNEELTEWLTYWLYEAPLMESDATVVDKEGKEYNFKKEKDVIKFLEGNF